MMAFPEDWEPGRWYLEPDAQEVNRRWQSDFAALVRGSDDDNLIWLGREPFVQRCGFASRFRLFHPAR